MLPSTTISIGATTVVLVPIAFISYAFLRINFPRKKRQRLRRKLPYTLDAWRIPGNCQEAEEKMWQDLDQVFRDKGYLLWPNAYCNTLRSPGLTLPLSSGFGYAIPSRTEPKNRVGSVGALRRFDYINPLMRVARTRDGHDVVIRVIVIQNEGHKHLNILRRLAVGENSLFNNNHTLPMFAEFQLEDIVFGIFPKVGDTCQSAYNSWPMNSVGDVVDMLMQMLEALAFIHDLNIAHRDAFRDNFVVQWHPESMRTIKVSPSRPRVHLIDFEVAVDFPMDRPAHECFSIGYPLGGSIPEPEMYARPLAPEFNSGKPYNPFKLDVWQLGKSFLDFKSTIASIDEVVEAMTCTDPEVRLCANEALEKLQTVTSSMAPKTLLVEPVPIR